MNLYNPPDPGGAVTVQTNETGSRAVNGTVYQNTTSKPKFCTITVLSSAAGENQIVVYCDAAANPTLVVAAYLHNSTVAQGQGSVSFWILPNYYYKAVLAGGALTLTKWIEWN